MTHSRYGARPWWTALATAALIAGVLAAPTAAQSPAAPMVSPNCGTDPVELLAYFESGFTLPQELAKEFTKQFPNVTWNIREDQFANLMQQSPLLLAGDNPPDLIRLPSMVSLATDGLLLNLDPYVTAYGWDKWSPAMLVQNRVDENGQRGSGSLFAAGLNYSMTGIFYNKDLAAQIGMTEPPKTLAELETLLQAAKDAGLQPIMQWGDAASGMGLAFPLQNLMASLGPTEPINDWIFQKDGAAIDTPANLEAAQHLETWVKNGYFPADINATSYTQANARFGTGEGVFMFNGDWQNAAYDAALPGKVGVFLMPPATEGGPHGAMSAPFTFGIAANAKHADCAAFFLNWVATDPTARQIDVTVGGSNPGGPSDLPIPTVAEGSVTNDTLAAGQVVSQDNGAMDFIANATGAIFAQGWTPELQKMVGGQQTADGLLKAVQAEYEKELSQ